MVYAQWVENIYIYIIFLSDCFLIIFFYFRLTILAYGTVNVKKKTNFVYLIALIMDLQNR